MTHGVGVEDTAGHYDFGRKSEAFSLQLSVDLTYVAQLEPPLCRSRPGLNQIEDLGSDVFIQRRCGVGLQEGGEIVHKLARSYLFDEMRTPILDTCVCQTQGCNLDIWIWVAYSLLERTHGIFRLNGFGTDQVRYFEVEGDVFSVEY